MSINLGNQNIKKLHLGETKIKEAYLGGQLIYQSTLPIYQTAIVNNGYLYTTTDNWDTFIQRTNLSSRPFSGVAICSSQPLVQTVVATGGGLFTTTDGWNTISNRGGGVLPQTWQGVFICASDPLIQAASYGNTNSIITQDGWKTYNPTNAGSLIYISASNPQKMFAVARSGYPSAMFPYLSDNSVYGFLPINVLGRRRWISLSMSVYNDSYMSILSDQGILYTTINSWQSINKQIQLVPQGTVVTNSMIAISAINPLIQSCNINGTVYFTKDGWNNYNSLTLQAGSGGSVSISSTNPLIQSCSTSGRYIYTTLDGWNTYSQITNVGSLNWSQIVIS